MVTLHRDAFIVHLVGDTQKIVRHAIPHARKVRMPIGSTRRHTRWCRSYGDVVNHARTLFLSSKREREHAQYRGQRNEPEISKIGPHRRISFLRLIIVGVLAAKLEITSIRELQFS